MVRRIAFALMLILLTGCSPAEVVEPTATLAPTNTPEPPTATPIPTDTPTPIPTPLPGREVVDIQTLEDSIPWVSSDTGNYYFATYYVFNVQKPPFNDPLVRKAFIAALDREALFLFNNQYLDNHPNRDTFKMIFSVTPPEDLGRDLGSDFGIPFDPHQARQYFNEAGYSNPELFPPVTFMVPYTGVVKPGGNYLLTAREAAAMWEEHLGITVKVVDYNDYYNNLDEEAENIFYLRWRSPFNDPHYSLSDMFHSNAKWNSGGYSNSTFDSLIDQAERDPSNPESRQLLYLQAERILIEEDAVVIPLWYYTTPR